MLEISSRRYYSRARDFLIMKIKFITLEEWEREALRYALAELLGLETLPAARATRLAIGGNA